MNVYVLTSAEGTGIATFVYSDRTKAAEHYLRLRQQLTLKAPVVGDDHATEDYAQFTDADDYTVILQTVEVDADQ